jgi:hypothetical protein
VVSDPPREQNHRPDGEEFLKEILRSFDEGLSYTLRDAYQKNPQISWADYMGAVNRLIAEGFLMGKGDGFVVHYLLTNKGRNAIAHNGSSHLSG